jgi:hypothetical protein
LGNLISLALMGGGWMWDLTVPGSNDHDFYVTVTATTAVLVHNCPEGQEVANNVVDHTDARVQEGDGTHYISGVSPDNYVSYIDGILDGDTPGVETRYLSGGRVGYYDPSTGVVIIEDGDSGTFLTPGDGKEYFDDLR